MGIWVCLCRISMCCSTFACYLPPFWSPLLYFLQCKLGAKDRSYLQSRPGRKGARRRWFTNTKSSQMDRFSQVCRYKFVFLIFWDSFAFESWFVSECVQGLEMQSHENSVFKEMLCPCFLQRQPFHARNFLLGSLASFPNSAIMKKHVAMLQYDSSLFDFFVVNWDGQGVSQRPTPCAALMTDIRRCPDDLPGRCPHRTCRFCKIWQKIRSILAPKKTMEKSSQPWTNIFLSPGQLMWDV